MCVGRLALTVTSIASFTHARRTYTKCGRSTSPTPPTPTVSSGRCAGACAPTCATRRAASSPCGGREMAAALNAGHDHVVEAAARGDERAWDTLVTRYTPMLRRVAKDFRLPPHDI